MSSGVCSWAFAVKPVERSFLPPQAYADLAWFICTSDHCAITAMQYDRPDGLDVPGTPAGRPEDGADGTDAGDAEPVFAPITPTLARCVPRWVRWVRWVQDAVPALWLGAKSSVESCCLILCAARCGSTTPMMGVATARCLGRVTAALHR